MAQISLLVRIHAEPKQVYELVATPEGIAEWFTDATLTNHPEADVPELTLWGQTTFDVTELIPSNRIVWHCTSPENSWFGTDIAFEFRAESGRTVLTFDHLGWPEVTDQFRDCAMSWAYFLESLRSLVEDGEGTPEGIAPPCDVVED